MKVLIFVPTYNEAENVEKLFNEISALRLGTDILLLDDNSPDGTGGIIDRIASEHSNVFTIHRSGKQGIGSAHATGIRWAYDHGYDLLLTMDCDFTHAPDRLPEFIEHSETHEVVIGSRYMVKGSLREWNLFRKTLTHLGHLLTRIFLRMPFDATGAFRAYRLDRIPQGVFELVQSPSYSFFFESLYVLWRNGATIHEIPLFLFARTYGHSKMATKDAVRSFLLLVEMYWQTLISKRSFVYKAPVDAPSRLAMRALKK